MPQVWRACTPLSWWTCNISRGTSAPWAPLSYLKLSPPSSTAENPPSDRKTPCPWLSSQCIYIYGRRASPPASSSSLWLSDRVALGPWHGPLGSTWARCPLALPPGRRRRTTKRCPAGSCSSRKTRVLLGENCWVPSGGCCCWFEMLHPWLFSLAPLVGVCEIWLDTLHFIYVCTSGKCVWFSGCLQLENESCFLSK